MSGFEKDAIFTEKLNVKVSDILFIFWMGTPLAWVVWLFDIFQT